MVDKKLVEKQPFKGKFALICGGSKGIGKATAKLFIQFGGSVCIVARTPEPLKEAAMEISQFKSEESQYVETIACDSTDDGKLKPEIAKVIDEKGVPNYLFNFVGISFPNYIEKLTLDEFKNHMNINYYGQLVPILLVLPYFMERKEGYLINASSVSGYSGQMGYAAYAPTKFAIAGLSEVLRHELKPFNIYVSVFYPPDTETPGLQDELETRPEELNIISETWGGLMQPEEVAEFILKKVLKKEYYILPGSSKFLWRVMRLFPKLFQWISDRDLKKARKKLGKES